MPPAIRTLADQWLTDPVDVRVAPATVTAETIQQSVFFVDQKQKLQLLTHWLQETAWTRTLVFTRTKHGADKVAKSLVKAGIRGRRLPQQQEPIGPAARAAPLQGAAAAGAGGHRHRRPRAGHRRRLARGQLRSAGRRRQLHPSHRPHGPGGRGRRRRLVLRSRRAVESAGNPTAHAANAGGRSASGRHAGRAAPVASAAKRAEPGRPARPASARPRRPMQRFGERRGMHAGRK